MAASNDRLKLQALSKAADETAAKEAAKAEAAKKATPVPPAPFYVGGTKVNPTTPAPTTPPPTTEAPTTEAPTTEAPTTEAPTTEAPTTEAPTTEGGPIPGGGAQPMDNVGDSNAGAVVPDGIDYNQATNDAIASLTTTVNNLTTQLAERDNISYGLLATQNAQADAAKAQQQTNWKTEGQKLLDQYGLGTLGSTYVDLITTKGMDQSTAFLELQSSDAWKQRFSANETRLKQGLPVLSPADYLNTEASYKDIMIKAGLPSTVINDTNYLGKLIAQDVSPVEVQQRIEAARTALNSEDPYVKQQLQQQFNLTTGDLTMHLLDPTVTSNIIAQKVNAAQIGAEAQKQNVGISAQSAQALAAQGITQGQAQQGFMQIGEQLPEMQAIASRFGANTPTLGLGGALQASVFGTAGGAQAQQQLARLRAQEANQFGGSSGAAKGSLDLSDTSGLQ